MGSGGSNNKTTCNNCNFPSRSKDEKVPCPHCDSRRAFRFLGLPGWYLYPAEITLLWRTAQIILGILLIFILIILSVVVYKFTQLQMSGEIDRILVNFGSGRYC